MHFALCVLTWSCAGRASFASVLHVAPHFATVYAAIMIIKRTNISFLAYMYEPQLSRLATCTAGYAFCRINMFYLCWQLDGFLQFGINCRRPLSCMAYSMLFFPLVVNDALPQVINTLKYNRLHLLYTTTCIIPNPKEKPYCHLLRQTPSQSRGHLDAQQQELHVGLACVQYYYTCMRVQCMKWWDMYPC